MSIVVAVRVGEGLVVATDSASTISVPTPDGGSAVAKVYNHATKLLQLGTQPIAVASWGAGNIGARTVTSVIEEYAATLKKTGAADESVQHHAEALLKHIKKAFEATGTAEAVQVGVFLGGYSGAGFFPDEYAFVAPKGEIKQLRKPLNDGQPDFGADWYGMTDAIIRLHHGRDDRLPAILEEEGVSKDAIQRVMQRFAVEVQYPVPFPVMPLQDAVDYALYAVGVVIGRHRFALGAEVCGGPIDVAAITRAEGFRWVRRKELIAHPFGP